MDTCPNVACSAPICPIDKGSLKNARWYPDEPVCPYKEYANLPWIITQKRIAKKARHLDRFFTYKDFQKKRAQAPRGHDPNLLVEEK